MMGHQAPKAARGGYISQTIQRAFDVLEDIASQDARGGLTLTELSNRLKLPRPTTLRLLANLETRGFVEQDAARRFHIGLPLFSIGAQSLVTNDLMRCARPYLEDLALKVGESTYLAIVHHDEVLYVDRIESPQPARAVSPIGSHRPLHSTAVGKVLLAGMSPEQVDGIISRIGLPPRTWRTITNPGVLRERLAEISANGYDVDQGEYDEGLTCGAAPIRDPNGRLVAALGLSGPSWRIGQDRLSHVLAALCNTACSISAELNHKQTLAPRFLSTP